MKYVTVIVLCLMLVSCASSKIMTLRIIAEEIDFMPPIISDLMRIKGTNVDITIVREAVRKVDKVEVPQKSNIKITSGDKEITILK